MSLNITKSSCPNLIYISIMENKSWSAISLCTRYKACSHLNDFIRSNSLKLPIACFNGMGNQV
uniref:Uncharacterized protein n=1 Tax=Tetranychus urticae TaxID=32264 RepID=A0A158P500_TETUR